MKEHRNEPAAQDAKLEGACPSCEGPLDARITPGGVWTWCPACRLLAHPRLVQGPSGAAIVHLAAAA